MSEYAQSEYTQLDRKIRIDTALGTDDLLLTSIDGTEGISELFALRLEVLSENDAIPAREIVGKPASITVELVDGGQRHFHGFVNRFYFKGRGDRLSLYEATLVPWAWFLSLNADCRIFQGRTVIQIIEEVFATRSIAEYDTSMVTGHHPPREYCVQYRESDLDFVSRLMEEEGIHYHFRHEPGKHVMVLADTNDVFEACHEYEVECRTNEASHDLSDHITSWRHGYEYTTGRFSHTTYNFKTPQDDLGAKTPTMVDLDAVSQYEVFDFPIVGTNRDDTEQFVRMRMEEREQAHDRVFATSKCRTFKAGGRFKLTRHHASVESEKVYVITRIHHRLTQPAEFVSGGSHGDREYENEFECIPEPVTFRPPLVTRKPAVRGAQTAVVVGPSGQEIYTDEYARIKVQFHWDRYGNRDEQSSCWMRVAQPTAGKGWGTVAIPRIGHEVLIHFLEGDPDQPLVMGCVYNGSNLPPVSNAGRKEQSPTQTPEASQRTTLRSNSLEQTGGYNEITMDDTSGNESLYIKAQYDEIHEVGNDRTDTVGNDETIDIGNDRTETVGNDESITIGNDRTETVGVDEQLTIGANRTHTIGANDTLTVGANRTVTVGGMAAESVGAAKALSIGAGYQVSVGAIMNETVAGARASEVGAYSAEVVGGKKSVTVGSDLTVSVSGKSEESAQEVQITGDTKIVLSCGASTITLTPGLIEIKAPMVKINC